jgi:hypothetical protein
MRSTTPLYLSWLIALIIFTIGAILLPSSWPWWLLRLAAFLLILGFVTVSARWYLQRGVLPRWWPSFRD